MIFYEGVDEKVLAEIVIKEQQANYSLPIVTTLEAMAIFWRAEEYNQEYFKKRGISEGYH